ncbi:hypothetical protein Hamer_G014177 [Homarus americanus]|uniref:Uncharacterized protein n=1 Tax=Homarus americanus TaxID=6706 RepID=A0A8J5JPI6_HOMAM|nr:hypothetical protein Hamer_G014177 [Homarus americanus]
MTSYPPGVRNLINNSEKIATFQESYLKRTKCLEAARDEAQNNLTHQASNSKIYHALEGIQSRIALTTFLKLYPAVVRCMKNIIENHMSWSAESFPSPTRSSSWH